MHRLLNRAMIWPTHLLSCNLAYLLVGGYNEFSAVRIAGVRSGVAGSYIALFTINAQAHKKAKPGWTPFTVGGNEIEPMVGEIIVPHDAFHFAYVCLIL